jgi:hypothetical protein
MGSLARGLSRPGGEHGDASTVARDAYGVIRSFVASLMGQGPRDHTGWHRAGCLAFSGVSLPLQFLPLAIALARKRGEANTVRRASAELNAMGAHAPRGAVQISEGPW